MVKFVDDFMASHQVNNAQLEATLRKQKERLGELVNCTIRRDCQVMITKYMTDTMYSNAYE